MRERIYKIKKDFIRRIKKSKVSLEDKCKYILVIVQLYWLKKKSYNICLERVM